MSPRNLGRPLRLEAGRDRLVAIAFGVSVGILLAIVVFRIVAGFESRRAVSRLESVLSERSSAFLRELTANAEVVYATRSLYSSSREVSREEFGRFTQDALSRRPAIRALEWIPRVTEEERAFHVQRARQDGFARYRITERTPSGELIAASKRDEYFPVSFVEPQDGNELALGFDLASDPARRKALARAIATGELTLTDPIELVQYPEPSKGLLALVPVLDDGHGSPGSLAGFALGVLRYSEIAKVAFTGGTDPRADSIRLELVLDDPRGSSEVLYASHPGAPANEARWSRRQAIEFGGQRWQLRGHAASSDIPGGATWLPLGFGVCAFFLTQLLFAYVAVHLDRIRDRAVTKQARMMRSVLRSVDDGVLVANKRGRFVLANRAAQDLVVGDANDVSPASWSEEFGIYLPDTKTPYPAEELPLARAIRGESSSETEVFVRNARAPAGMWLSVNGTPLVDEAGLVRGGVVVFRDISQRKSAEETRLQLANAVEQTADAVLITDREGMIEYVNPAFESTTGYTRAEVLHRNPRFLKSGAQDRQFYERMWQTILAGEVCRTTTINRRKDGSLYPTEQTITPIRDSGGRLTHFVSVVRDMTEHRKNLESEAEMQLAAQVQKKLYPQSAPEIPGYDIRGAVLSADATCGDYFDFIDMPDSAIGLAIGDVSGHGIGAALVMAETRALLRTAAHSSGDPAEIFRSTNHALARDLEDHRYVTVLLARLDPATGHLIYSSAGHTPGYIIDSTGCPRRFLNSAGRPLGMFPDSEYLTGGEADLQPGELLVLLTDGVEETESPDGEFFGADRALATLARHRGDSAQRIIEEMQRSIRTFSGDQSLRDDVTIVVCKRREIPC